MHLMVRQKHRNRGMFRGLPGFGLDSETQSQFLNSTSEVPMSDMDKMKETNVLQTGRKEDSMEMLHSPSYMITPTSSQEETDLRFECTVNHCESQRPVCAILTGNGLWPPATAIAKVFCL